MFLHIGTRCSVLNLINKMLHNTANTTYPVFWGRAFHPACDSSHFTVKHFVCFFYCNTCHITLNANVKKLLNPTVYASTYKEGRDGCGQPWTRSQEDAWSPIIGQRLSLVGRATQVAEKSYIQPACLITYWMWFKFTFSLS